MSREYVLFLDDGGVMNDNALRGPQWQTCVADYMTPRFGSTHQAWAVANRKVVVGSGLFKNFVQRTFHKSDVSFADFQRAYALTWTKGMFNEVGLLVPPDEACIDIMVQAHTYACTKVISAFPEAAETVQALHRQGYELYTASNGASYELEGILTTTDVRECFIQIYGTDLVDIMKESPEYYRRVFMDAEVDPARAVVVDDRLQNLEYAAEFGARTILVKRNDERRDSVGAIKPNAVIASLTELPKVLKMLN
jgi:HAD superfamily hydrolase (TIGR01509 family)